VLIKLFYQLFKGIWRSLDYYDGGPRYNTSYIQCCGLGTVTDNLSALKKHVFEDKTFSLDRVLNALLKNFEGEELLRQTIHRVVDTAGHVRTELILEIAKRTDLFLYDLKMMDPVLHQRWTNVRNEKILHNLKTLAAAGAHIIIRIPLIGGVNDTDENITQTAKFISGLAGGKKDVHLLPYHNIAQNKYIKLGKSDDFETLREPGKESLARAIAKFAEYGITASIGG